jgi:hypothetical protein
MFQVGMFSVKGISTKHKGELCKTFCLILSGIKVFSWDSLRTLLIEFNICIAVTNFSLCVLVDGSLTGKLNHSKQLC